MVFVEIAAEYGHGAYAEAKGEEGLVHCAHYDVAGYLGKVGHKVEGETLRRSGQREAVYR